MRRMILTYMMLC